MHAEEIFSHICDLCGAGVECIGTRAAFALETEWYISPFTDFCSECRTTEYAARVIGVETALLDKKRAASSAARLADEKRTGGGI